MVLQTNLRHGLMFPLRDVLVAENRSLARRQTCSKAVSDCKCTKVKIIRDYRDFLVSNWSKGCYLLV